MALQPDLIATLAKQFHTPLYVFEEAIIRKRCKEITAAIPYSNKVLRYACKALTIGAILKIIRNEGFKIDASSLNEALRAIHAGYTSDEILYTGESASRLVFQELLERKISLNCSSLDQLRLIGELAPGTSCSIRFNPGEGHGANDKVNTGGPASKHGVYYDQIDEVKKLLRTYKLKLSGVHSHIGSGTDLNHWLRIKDILFEIAKKFEDLTFIDLGGGLPVVYNPQTDKPMPLKEWGARLSESFVRFSKEYGKEMQLQVEPGRFLVAECGHLLAEVQCLKHTPSYNFAVVNTGLNHNPRPAMYGSYHPIYFIAPDGGELKGAKEYVIAGYLCESGDIFTVKEGGELAPRVFPELQVGDLMVMGNIGAYSHAMKSEYNSMNLPASVLITQNGSVEVIERRGTVDDLLRREVEVYNKP